TWRYGHHKQILLDGTFGVCDRRLLLFIVMGVDERNHGVPLTLPLFSAPAGNKSTSSGYDTSILIKLLAQWKEAVSSYSQREFKPTVAIKDTDFKERGALLDVFPDIRLLICRFHLHQAWTNHRRKVRFRNIPGGSMVCDRLLTLENQLIHSTNDTVAWNTAQQEIAALNQLAADHSYTVAASKGLTHVQSLSSYWMAHALWQNWSEFGRLTAAAVIRISLEAVIPTTNHLESFNGVLKHKHLKRWSRGGRRVRADTLVNILATKIAPSIFQQRRLEEERVMLRKALKGVQGASQLLENTQQKLIEPPIAFLEPDARRDSDAARILELNRLSVPIVQQAGIQLTSVARAAHCVNEALQGGFLSDLVEVDDTGAVVSEYKEELDTGSEVGEEESDNTLLSSGDEIDESIGAGASARGLAEQLNARTTYTMKRNLRLTPEIHTELDRIHHRDLEDSIHREEYEKYAYELELLTTRIRGLLRRAGPSAPSTQLQGAQPLSQHNTATTPTPASPERRQYRKDSRSLH
ncbi:hypothetical protein FRC11_006006, partial [Ceratobasidium sp. 423]